MHLYAYEATRTASKISMSTPLRKSTLRIPNSGLLFPTVPTCARITDQNIMCTGYTHA